MSRSRSSAKQAGSRFERQVADAFAWHTKNDTINRMPHNGSKDQGDIANLRTRDGQRVAVECKDTARFDIGGWVREAGVEALNYNALCGIVVHKRRGHGDPLDQYVTMTMRDLLLIGWGVHPAATPDQPEQEQSCAR